MLDVVDFDQPDQEAYGRVTNPERYQAVVDAARGMIAESEKRLDRGEWKRHGVPAVHRWPAWPKP